jgi:prevent-host-death family protein
MEVSITEARANLGKLVTRVNRGEVVTIKRDGNPEAVMISQADWTQLEDERDLVRMELARIESRGDFVTLEAYRSERAARAKKR